MNSALRGLKKQTDQLRNRFDTTQSLTNNVTTLLLEATPIDTYMRLHVLTDRTQHDWFLLRADINKLAGAYDLSEVGGK